jgi:uncharacterized phage-associated protein
MTSGHDSRAVANQILDIAEQQGIKLTLMQLIKLVYLAHGWWLTFSDGKPLTSSSPQAWQYGPVHPEVYRAFKRYGRGHISGRAVNNLTGFEYSEDFTADELALLEQVVASYGKYHAFTLSDIMHRPGTPWSTVNSEFGDYSPIPNNIIKRHFDDLREERNVG